jgi:hypothetical protein
LTAVNNANIAASEATVNSISTAAFEVLNARASSHQRNFFVYEDADSGLNHGFHSGFFGAVAKIDLDTACINDPSATDGCSNDPNQLDRQHGNVLRISFAPLKPDEFAGINIEEPENYGTRGVGVGYDLRGTQRVVFEARSPTPGGIQLQFGVGNQTTDFIQIPKSTEFKEISIDLGSLGLAASSLDNNHILFTIVTNGKSSPSGGIVLLDNIRFDPVPTSQRDSQGFPLANETFGVVPVVDPTLPQAIPTDQATRNLTTIYESSLVLIALLHRGKAEDLVNARLIADALVYALQHEIDGQGVIPPAQDGSRGLHDGYSSGDLALFNDQAEGGTKGQIRLSGFTGGTTMCGPNGFCVVLDGATGGNNAFAIMALVSAYRKLDDQRYLDAARNIGRWIVQNLTDITGTGFGGYYLGYLAGEIPRTLARGKSIENNAAIYAAFTGLAEIEQELGSIANSTMWTNRANIAGDFVMKMFEPVSGRFYAGTIPAGPDGPPAGPGLLPHGIPKGNDFINTWDFMDSNSIAILALADAQRYRDKIDWRRPMAYVLANFKKIISVSGKQFQGFSIVGTPTIDDFRANPIDGIAWEFTAQAVVTMRLVDRIYNEMNYTASALNYLNQIREAQLVAPFADGKGIVASTLNNGDKLSPLDQCLNVTFQCIPERVGLAATVWAIFADLDINVFTVR